MFRISTSIKVLGNCILSYLLKRQQMDLDEKKMEQDVRKDLDTDDVATKDKVIDEMDAVEDNANTSKTLEKESYGEAVDEVENNPVVEEIKAEEKTIEGQKQDDGEPQVVDGVAGKPLEVEEQLGEPQVLDGVVDLEAPVATEMKVEASSEMDEKETTSSTDDEGSIDDEESNLPPTIETKDLPPPSRFFDAESDYEASQIEEVISDTLDTDDLWQDTAFPATAYSLYVHGIAPRGALPSQLLGWKRIHQGEIRACSSPELFPREGLSAIKSGSLPESCFLAAMTGNIFIPGIPFF